MRLSAPCSKRMLHSTIAVTTRRVAAGQLGDLVRVKAAETAKQTDHLEGAKHRLYVEEVYAGLRLDVLEERAGPEKEDKSLPSLSVSSKNPPPVNPPGVPANERTETRLCFAIAWEFESPLGTDNFPPRRPSWLG